jgi:hypothetical protein
VHGDEGRAERDTDIDNVGQCVGCLRQLG